MQIYEDDFRSEREDREKAHSKIAEMETRYVKKVESMTNELQTKARELQVSWILHHNYSIIMHSLAILYNSFFFAGL